MMDGRILLPLQFCCLLVTAAGWGGWVWLIAGRPAPFRHAAWLWCGLAGFCAQALILQGLLYLDLPLSRTAWPAFGVALAGLLAGAWLGRRGKGRGLQPSLGEVRLLGGVLVTVLAVESVGVLWVGVPDYFGKGRFDQANYVVTAQFLVDRPFSSTIHDVALHPWMARALETKEQRITQSVAQGALAVISGTDCQQAYAAMTAFFMGLTGLAVTAWLRCYSVPRWLAAIGGAGAALGPAVTTLQLDGYFSQTSTLFVLPALAALLTPRRSLDGIDRWAAALLLAYWVGAYTEVAVVGVGLVLVLRLTANSPWRARASDLAWIGAGTLLLNPGYTARLPGFLSDQLARAQNPNLLAGLFPDSGTWLGWSRLFFDLAPGGVATAAGGLVLGLMLCAVMLLPRRRRGRLLATLAVPAVLLGWLGLQPVLAKYPFAKLLAGFAPLWVGTAVLGIVALGRLRPGGQAALAALMLGVGAVSALPQRAQVIHRDGVLAELNSPAMHRMRAEAHRHPERSYLVASDHPLVAQWLCYFARTSNVYLDRRHLGDRIVPSESYAFRQLPDAATELWWLDLSRAGPVGDFPPARRLRVSGAVEEGTIAIGKYYVMRDTLQLEVQRRSAVPPVEQLWLDLVGIPLPGTTPFELELVGPGSLRQRTTMIGPRLLRFHLALAPGKNAFTLQIASDSPAAESKRGIIFQSLSLDPITAVEVANDPVPVEFVR